MRLNYLSYRFKDVSSDSLYWHDLHPLLRSFCSIPDPLFRNGFKNGDDRVFLLHQTENLFLFIQTQNTSVIEQIDTQNHKLKDIEALLDENDALGIASYVYVSDKFIAYCSPSLAPRFPVFFRFINEVLEKLKVHGYAVVCEPILTQSTLADVKAAAHIGRSTITLEASRSLLQDLTGFMGDDADDYSILDAIEVTFRPKSGKSAKKVVSRLLERDEVRKANIRGKLDYADRVLDLYIDSSGPVTDIITLDDKRRVYEKIVAKISGNSVLQKKLTGLAGNETITPLNDHRIDALGNIAAWSSHLPDLLLDGTGVAQPPAGDK